MDKWDRKTNFSCDSCMFLVPRGQLLTSGKEVCNCKRHPPVKGEYPIVFKDDWCGEHKIGSNPVRDSIKPLKGKTPINGPWDSPAAKQSWDTTVYGLASKVDDNTRKDTSEYVKSLKYKQECVELYEPCRCPGCKKIWGYQLFPKTPLFTKTPPQEPHIKICPTCKLTKGVLSDMVNASAEMSKAKIKAEIKQTIDNMCNDGLGISSDITKITDYRQKIAELLGKL